MTLNIKIADKMCSKGKIKFCVKELKLEKRLLISFGGITYHLLLLQNYMIICKMHPGKNARSKEYAQNESKNILLQIRGEWKV